MTQANGAWEKRSARTALMLTQEQMQRLNKAHAMLFGLGGVGSYAAEALARAGVGKITLVDADTVAESNCNRQLCALGSTIGRKKVDVVSARLLDINPEADICGIQAFYLPESPVEIPEDVAVVLDAIDTVSAKIHLAQTCWQRKLPMVSCMGMGNRFNPTQIRIGDVFATAGDPLCRIMRKELRKRGVEQLRCVYSVEPPYISPDNGKPGEQRPVTGSLPYVPSVGGLYLAYEAIRMILE